MYNPPSFAVEDAAGVRALLDAQGFAHLVTVDADSATPSATAAPFLVDEGLRTVWLHLARANGWWRQADGRAALLIVPGTDGYVSPRWYPSKAIDGKVVPTWNYEVVHVHGTVRVTQEASELRAIVAALTDRFEAAQGAPAWSLDDAPDEYVDTMLRGIVGVELTVERIDAKRKLSQNRPVDDVRGVVAGLRAPAGPRSPAGAAAATAQRHRLADAVEDANRHR